MRISKLSAILASAALLLSLQLASPTPAHADNYQLQVLGSDGGTTFYGMDDAGHAVFSFNGGGSPACMFSSTCYSESGVSGLTSIAPNLAYDFTSAPCSSPTISSSCSLTFDGITATISANPIHGDNLSVTSGSDPSQLLATADIAGVFAINGVGDIVFDNGLQDEWIEAVDLTSTALAESIATATLPPSPAAEPSALILLATGMLVPIFFLRRRAATVRP